MTWFRMFRDFTLWQAIMLVGIGVAYSQMISPSCPHYESLYCACSPDELPELKTMKMCLYQTVKGSGCRPCPNSLQDRVICDECSELSCPVCSQNIYDIKGLYNRMHSYVRKNSGIDKEAVEIFSNYRYTTYSTGQKNLEHIGNDEIYFPKSSDETENANNTNGSIIAERKYMKNAQPEYHQNKIFEQEEIQSSTIPADSSEVYVYDNRVEQNRSDGHVIISRRDTDIRNKQSFIETNQNDTEVVNKTTKDFISDASYLHSSNLNLTPGSEMKNLGYNTNGGKSEISNIQKPHTIKIPDEKWSSKSMYEQQAGWEKDNEEIENVHRFSNKHEVMMNTSHNLSGNLSVYNLGNKHDVEYKTHTISVEGNREIHHEVSFENSEGIKLKHDERNKSALEELPKYESANIRNSNPHNKNVENVLNIKESNGSKNFQLISEFDNTDYNTTVKNEDDSKSFHKLYGGMSTKDRLHKKAYASDISLNKSTREKCETEKIVNGNGKKYFFPMFNFRCVIYRMPESPGSNNQVLNTTDSKKNKYSLDQKNFIPLLSEILRCLNDSNEYYSVIDSQSEVVVSNCPFSSLPDILLTLIHTYINQNDNNAKDVNSPVTLLHKVSVKLTDSLNLSINAFTKYSISQNSSDDDLTKISLNDTGKLLVANGRLRINITLSLINSQSNESESKLPLKNIQASTESELKYLTEKNSLNFPSTLHRNIIQVVKSQINDTIYEEVPKSLRGFKPIDKVKIKVTSPFPFTVPSNNKSNENTGSVKKQRVIPLGKRLIQKRNAIYDNDSKTITTESHALLLLPEYNVMKLETSNNISTWTDLKINAAHTDLENFTLDRPDDHYLNVSNSLMFNDNFIRNFYKVFVPFMGLFNKKQIEKGHDKPRISLQTTSSYIDSEKSSESLNSTYGSKQSKMDSYNPIKVKISSGIYRQSTENDPSRNHDRNITIIVWGTVFVPSNPKHHFLQNKKPLYNGVLKYLPSSRKDDPLKKDTLVKNSQEFKNSSHTSGHAAKQLQTKDDIFSMYNRKISINGNSTNFPIIHADPVLVLLKNNQETPPNSLSMNHSRYDVRKDNGNEYQYEFQRTNGTNFYNLKDKLSVGNDQVYKYYLSTNGTKSNYLLHTEFSDPIEEDYFLRISKKIDFIKENSREKNQEGTLRTRNESKNEIPAMRVFTRRLLENSSKEDEENHEGTLWTRNVSTNDIPAMRPFITKLLRLLENSEKEDEEEPDHLIIRLRQSDNASKSTSQELIMRTKREMPLPHNKWCAITIERRHGNMECTVWSFKKSCKLECHEGYRINSKSDKTFYCRRKEDKWTPSDIIPCQKRAGPKAGEKDRSVTGLDQHSPDSATDHCVESETENTQFDSDDKEDTENVSEPEMTKSATDYCEESETENEQIDSDDKDDTEDVSEPEMTKSDTDYCEESEAEEKQLIPDDDESDN